MMKKIILKLFFLLILTGGTTMALKPLGLQTVYLDMGERVIDTFNCNNADVATRGLDVHVRKDGITHDCTGVTLKLYIRTANLDLYESVSATVGDATGVFEVLYPEGLPGGKATGEIILSNSTETIGSFQFEVNIIQSLTSDGSIIPAPGAGILFSVIANENARVATEAARVIEFNNMIANGYIIPKSPVTTFADLATTYPAPVAGWTAKTLDDGKLYRYSGTAWIWIDTVTTSAYDALVNDMGDKEDLTTTEKSNLVGAINENVSEILVTNDRIYNNESLTNIGATAVGMANGIDNIEIGFESYGVWTSDVTNPLKLTVHEDGLCTISGRVVASGAAANGVVAKLGQPTFSSGTKIAYQASSLKLVADVAVTPYLSIYFNGVTKYIKTGSVYSLLTGTARLYQNGAAAAYYIELNATQLSDIAVDCALMFNSSFYIPYFDKRPVYQRILELTPIMDEAICNFIYVPDIHLQMAGTRHEVGFGLINYMRSFYDMPVIANGDITDQQANVIIGASKSTHRKSIRKAMNLLGNNCFVTKGNHDDNSLQGTPNVVLPNTLETMMFAKMRPIGWDITMSENGTYYFADNEEYQIRFVFLNTHQNEYWVETAALGYINQDQLEWLANEALDLSSKEVPSDWHTAFFGHIPLNLYVPTPCENGDEAWNIIKAFLSGTSVTVPTTAGSTAYHSLTEFTKDFTAQGAKTVIGYFYGHIHKDDSFVQDTVNFIATVQFCSLGYNPTTITTNVIKGIYSINEFTFDLVNIRKTNRSINMYRVGNGADRTFVY
jgi:hypothetical protein